MENNQENTKSENTVLGGIWSFVVKTGIILIGIFIFLGIILPDSDELRSKLRRLDTEKSKLAWLSFIQNPQSLLKISEIEENEGKLDNAIRETELAIGLLEMHGADKQVIQRYTDRIKKLMSKKETQQKNESRVFKKLPNSEKE